MALCTRCGKKLGLFERLGEPICKSCEQELSIERDGARQRYAQVVNALAAGTVAPEDAILALKEVTPLAAYRPADLLRIYGHTIQSYIDRVLADDYLSEEEEKEFENITDALGMSEQDFLQLDRSMFSRLFVAQANAGRLNVLPESRTRLIAKKDEAVHLEVPAGLMKEVAIRQYQGGYSGVSFRVAKGVRFSTGGVRGKSVVVGTELQIEDEGLLAVSSKRAVFMGGKKTVEMLYSKLVSMNVYEDAIQFHVSNRQKATLLRVDSGALVAATVNAAAQRLENNEG